MPNWPRPSSRPSEYYVKCERLVQTSAEATATRARNTPAVQRGQERRSRNRRVVSQRAGAGQRLARQARSRTVCPTGSPAVPSCGALPCNPPALVKPGGPEGRDECENADSKLASHGVLPPGASPALPPQPRARRCTGVSHQPPARGVHSGRRASAHATRSQEGRRVGGHAGREGRRSCATRATRSMTSYGALRDDVGSARGDRAPRAHAATRRRRGEGRAALRGSQQQHFTAPATPRCTPHAQIRAASTASVTPVSTATPPPTAHASRVLVRGPAAPTYRRGEVTHLPPRQYDAILVLELGHGCRRGGEGRGGGHAPAHGSAHAVQHCSLGEGPNMRRVQVVRRASSSRV